MGIRGSATAVAWLLACGLGACAPMDGTTTAANLGDGTGADLGAAYQADLANHAGDVRELGRCAEVDGLDADGFAASIGTTPDEAHGLLLDQVRLEAFRRLLSLRMAIRYARAPTLREPYILPSSYADSPRFSDYFMHTHLLNRGMELEWQLLDRRLAAGSGTGDAAIDAAYGRIAEIDIRLAELDGAPMALDPAIIETERQALTREKLGLQVTITRHQQAPYQSELRRAAIELVLLEQLRMIAGTSSLGIHQRIALLMRDAVWPDRSDPEGLATVDLETAIDQIRAEFPILTLQQWDGIWSTNLAYELYYRYSDRDPQDWLFGLNLDENLLQYFTYESEDAAGLIAHAIPAFSERVEALAGDQFSIEDQRLVNEGLDQWLGEVDEALANLPGRSADDLLAYHDLVNGALLSAPPALWPLWMADWCTSESHQHLFDLGKAVVYLVGTVVSVVALVTGHLEIAIPLGAALSIGGFFDALASVGHARAMREGYSLLWVTYEDMSNAERQAAIELVLATVGLVGDGAAALHTVHLIGQWNNARRWLGTVAGRYDDAALAIERASAALGQALDAGAETTELTQRLAVLERIVEEPDDWMRFSQNARRTLDGMNAAQAQIGRVRVAGLMGQFDDGEDAIRFFERITLDDGWDALARSGYRGWLDAVREGGGGAPHPAVCW